MIGPRLFVLGSFVVACCARVERVPHPGESLLALDFSAEPGGKGFNVAIGAHELGAEVDCLLAVGDDLFGALAEPTLAARGLGVDLIRRCSRPTGAGIGFIQADGENRIAVFPGANAALSAEHVRSAGPRVRAAAMVVAQFEITDAPIAEAFTIARDAGRVTLLNPSPIRAIAPNLLMNTTILVVNETEALALAASIGLAPWPRKKTATFKALAHLATLLHAQGLELLVVTLGAAGAIAYPRGGEPLRQQPYAVDTVDVTGAGDAFIAAFATSYSATPSLSTALENGACGGALMAGRLGTLTSFPSRADLESRLQRGLYDIGHVHLAKDAIVSPKKNS